MIEYKQISKNLYMTETELNELGLLGWELRAIIDRAEPVRYVFARWLDSPVAGSVGIATTGTESEPKR